MTSLQFAMFKAMMLAILEEAVFILQPPTETSHKEKTENFL